MHVEDSVAEGGVQRDEEADGCAKDLDGADEEFPRELHDGYVPFFEFGVESPVSGGVAEGTGFGDEEDGRVGFVEEEDTEEEDEELEDAGEVLGPAPAEGGIDDEGGGHDRTWW